MKTCAHCGKVIKGKYVVYSPTVFEIILGTDSEKTFHPACFKKSGIATNVK